MIDLRKLFVTEIEARCVYSAAIPENCDALRFVDSHETLNTALEVFCENFSIASEGWDDLAVEPAALVLQCTWQIPVIKCHQRLNTIRQQFVNKLVIIV